jgi:carbohydrate-selective porin OprB
MIKIEGFEEAEFEVVVYSNQGQKLNSAIIEYDQRSSSIKLDISGQANGLYFCYVKQGYLMIMVRLIKN